MSLKEELDIPMSPEVEASSSDEEPDQTTTQVRETRGLRSARRPARYSEFVEDYDEEAVNDPFKGESDFDDYLSDHQDALYCEEGAPQKNTDPKVDPDFLLYCNDCKTAFEGDCPKHGPLIIVKDFGISKNTHAVKTAPPCLFIGNSELIRNAKGVFAKEVLPPRMRFGPLQGKLLPPNNWGKHSWLIRNNNKPYKCLDVSMPSTSNWMRYVTMTTKKSEKNCDAYQYQGLIFFKTIREIAVDEELVVGLHDYNGMVLKQDPEIDLPPKGTAPRGRSRKRRWMELRRKKEGKFKCEVCGKRFLYEQYVIEHMRIHTGEMPFKCDSCDRRFRFKGNRDKHSETHSKTAVKSVLKDGDETKPESRVTRASTRISTQAKETKRSDNESESESPSKSARTRENVPAESVEVSEPEKYENEEIPPTSAVTTKPRRQTTRKRRRKAKFILGMKTRDQLRPYKCGVCNLRLKQPFLLKEHMRTHTGEKPYVCDICNVGFARKFPLTEHMRVHTGEKPLKCPECPEMFSQKAKLRLHWKKHFEEKPQTAATEEPPTPAPENPQTAEENPQPADENPLPADEPQAEDVQTEEPPTDEQTPLEEPPNKPPGVLATHRNECTVCHQKFKSSTCLKIHMRTHTGEKPYVCGTCNRSFSRKYYLNVHMREHTGEKLFKCSKCSKTFLQKQNYELHCINVHGENGITSGMPRLSTKQAQCHVCYQSFKTVAGLKIHMKKHEDEKPYVCKQCDVAFSTQGTYNIHMGIHSTKNPFECETCHLRFAEEHDLMAHRRIIHHDDAAIFEVIEPSVKQFMCLLCNLAFGEQTDMVEHMDNEHLGEMLFMCDVCDEKFASLTDLDIHAKVHGDGNTVECGNQIFADQRQLMRNRRRVHGVEKTNENPPPEAPSEQCVCLLCDFVCHEQSELISHMNSHTGEMLFVCDVCDEKFNALGALESHQKKHNVEIFFECCSQRFSEKDLVAHKESAHRLEKTKADTAPEEPSKRCVCLLCDYTCDGQDDLLKHMETHTGAVLFVCEVCDKPFSTQDALDIHTRIHKNPFKCSECSECFAEERDLEAHLIRDHGGDEPEIIAIKKPPTQAETFMCLLCKFVCSVETDMLKHIQTHSQEMMIVCHVCDESFSTKSELDAHVEIHMKGNACSECEQRFATEQELTTHKNKEHKAEPKIDETEKPAVENAQYMCLVCKYVCSEESDMIKHTQLHSKEMLYVCNVCDEAFSAQESLDIHLRTHGREQQEAVQYVCAVCNAHLDSDANLRLHIMVSHTESTVFVCKVCGESFSSQNAVDTHLKKHRRGVHCPVCQYHTHNISRLKSHMRTHLGDRPFKCDVCSRGFARATALRLHKRLHGRNKPHKCSKCGKAYATQQNLTAHELLRCKSNGLPVPQQSTKSN